MSASESTPSGDPGRPGLGVLVLGFVAIFVLSVSSVQFAPGESDVAAWWPAAGIGTGLLALSSYRRWPVLLLLGVLVTGLANQVGGRDVVVSGLFGVANSMEWLVVAVLLGAHRHRPWLRSRIDFARLIAASAAGALVAGLLAALAVAVVLGGSLLSTAYSVTVSHGASQLLVVPVALLIGDPRARNRVTNSNPLIAIQVLSTAGVTIAVFRVGQDLPLAFLPVPFLVWGALILTLRALAVEALLVGALVTVLTARGGGPFGSLSMLSDRAAAALVQVDLVVIGLVTLPLALVMAERAVALTDAIAGREAARASQRRLGREQRFTANLLAATSGTSIIATDEHGVMTYVNSGTLNLLGHPAEALVGQPLTDIHDDLELDERMRELGAASPFEALIGSAAASHSHDWWYQSADGGGRLMSVRISPLLSDADELIGHLAVGEDITDR